MFFTSSKELGELIKKVRNAQGMTQPELAGACGTGVRFIVDLEKGKPTCEIGKVLLVTSMLGIRIEAHEPPKPEVNNG